jgi:hypothetical protein
LRVFISDMRKTFAAALLCATAAFPQGLRFGLKAGVPLTEYFETGVGGLMHQNSQYSAATRRYVIGASAEWRLTRAFGFELDALYHRMGYVAIVEDLDSYINITNSAIDVKGNSWDFPLMAKYRFGRAVRPFVAGGAVLRYAGPVRGRGTLTTYSGIAAPYPAPTVVTPIDTSDPSELGKRLYPGLTAGGGIEIGMGHFRLLPEMRYTRWTANISTPGRRAALRPEPGRISPGHPFLAAPRARQPHSSASSAISDFVFAVCLLRVSSAISVPPR